MPRSAHGRSWHPRGLWGAFLGYLRVRNFIRPGLAYRFAKGPFALMAEAAHVLPPLLAQGLNLSVKDAEIAGQLLNKYGPTERALRAYAIERRPMRRCDWGFQRG